MNAEKVPEQIHFRVWRETPTLDHYRRGWTPSPDVALAGMWLPGVVSDEGGQFYLGIRGVDDMAPGLVHTVTPIVGFRRLVQDMEGDPPHLFAEFAETDWFEPYEYTETSGRIVMDFESGRIERDRHGCHWFDANGRWELHGRTVSC
jgi:hypothetical protein